MFVVSKICFHSRPSCSCIRCDSVCDLILFHCGEPPSWIRSKYSFQAPMRYGFLSNVTTDQIAYATQASEAVVIVSLDRKVELGMVILRENYEHSDEKLYVAFYEDESDKLYQIIHPWTLSKKRVFIHGLTVEFEVKHNYFDSLVKSVNSVHQKIINRLIPTPRDFLQPTSVSEFDLKVCLSLLPNSMKIDGDNQFRALQTIVSCNRSSPPILVNGSFGTGKTLLLAVATHCLIHFGKLFNFPVRILVCAHHYHSVDHFIDQYFGKMYDSDCDIYLFRLISDTYHIRSKFSHLYVSSENMLNYLQYPPWFLVVVTEFLTAQSLSVLGEEYFTHIFLDEGSQTVEPQTIAPLSLAGPFTKVVIAGDSCQVRQTKSQLILVAM